MSALGFGGHQLGDEPTTIQIVQQAVDGGITFLDNCWEYHLGKSEDGLGKGLKGRRDEVSLLVPDCGLRVRVRETHY